MNIALVVPGGVDRSGERRVIPALLALLARLARNHRVRVFALDQEPRAAAWTLHGAQVINVGKPFPAIRAFAAIRREHAREPFNVIHAMWAGRGALAAVCAGRMHDVPVLVHLAGGELAALPEIGYGGGLRWAGRAAVGSSLRLADAVSAASLPMIEAAQRRGVHATRVPLGVDLDRWRALEPRPRDARSPSRLIHVASLNRVKDQATLLRALARLSADGREFHLDIVGEDTLNGQIQAQAESLGIAGHLKFHGFLTQTQLRPLMEAAHLNLVSSRHEAGPLVLLEAAVCGVPTVGTAVGHLAEWSPQAAVAVPVGDDLALALAIESVLADEQRRLALARAAQARALAADADSSAQSFLQLYGSMSRG